MEKPYIEKGGPSKLGVDLEGGKVRTSGSLEGPKRKYVVFSLRSRVFSYVPWLVTSTELALQLHPLQKKSDRRGPAISLSEILYKDKEPLPGAQGKKNKFQCERMN